MTAFTDAGELWLSSGVTVSCLASRLWRRRETADDMVRQIVNYFVSHLVATTWVCLLS
jgi:hypothetical protein